MLALKVSEQSSDQLAVWLAQRKIDPMIGRFTDDSQRSQFHYERLSGEQLMVVAGPHHPLRGTGDLELASFAHWPWLLYPPLTAVRKVSDDIFRIIGMPPASSILETTSFLFALESLKCRERRLRLRFQLSNQ